MKRRVTLALVAGVVLGSMPACRKAEHAPTVGAAPAKLSGPELAYVKDGVPVSGSIAPDAPQQLRAIDDAVIGLMKRHEIPCAAIAISKDGRLVLDRAFGYKDRDRTTPLPTHTLFRLASLEKLVTATALERMIAEGWSVGATGQRLSRDMRVFRALRDSGFIGPDARSVDPRLYEVTLDQMLTHKSGIATRCPPVEEVGKSLRLKRFPNHEDYLRWYIKQPMAAAPGSEKAKQYNNAAYDMLRCLVACLAGSYDGYVREHVLGRAGANELVMSKSRPQDRDPREVWYAASATKRSIFPEDHGAQLPVTDGGGGIVCWELQPAASAEALVAYLGTWYMGTGKPLLDGPGRLAQGNDNGLGVYFGSYLGTRTTMFQRRWTLCNGALLFNHGDERPGVKDEDIAKPIMDLLEAIRW